MLKVFWYDKSRQNIYAKKPVLHTFAAVEIISHSDNGKAFWSDKTFFIRLTRKVSYIL